MRRGNDTVTNLMQAGQSFALVLPAWTANILSMIGFDNQDESRRLLWLERAALAGGAAGIAVLTALRLASGSGLSYPASLFWLLACATLAAGCGLVYWRVTARQPH